MKKILFGLIIFMISCAHTQPAHCPDDSVTYKNKEGNTICCDVASNLCWYLKWPQ